MINELNKSLESIFYDLENNGYGFNFVHTEYSSIEECDGGCENDYCRCTRIEDARVEQVDKDNLVLFFNEHVIAVKKQIFNQNEKILGQTQNWLEKQKKQVLKILTDMGFMNTYQYRVEVDYDPYGETIGGTYFEDQQAIERLKYHILKLSLLDSPTDMSEHLSFWAQEEAPAITHKKTIKISKK